MAKESLTSELKFQHITLQKESLLGIGSYGSVFKAKCDDLVCAAKIVHPIFVHWEVEQPDSSKHEQRHPLRRFEAECEFLKDIRHPHIVQYLGLFQDPETGLPVLLMEYIDENLTNFLENQKDPPSESLQVIISLDVVRALSYLHSNEIVHRDLSSNNILILAKSRAKLSDFGMAKFVRPAISNTISPGTYVYMPPESMDNAVVFTEKGDIFSLGVIIIQILTKEFPKPGDRFKTLKIDHPQIPNGKVEVRASEVERRQEQIGAIDTANLMLPIALECLNDSVDNRPTSSELCQRILTLKTHLNNDDESTSGGSHWNDAEISSDKNQADVNELQIRVESGEQKIKTLQQGLQAAKEQVQQKEAKITAYAKERERNQQLISKYREQIESLEKQLPSVKKTHKDKLEEPTSCDSPKPPPPLPRASSKKPRNENKTNSQHTGQVSFPTDTSRPPPLPPSTRRKRSDPTDISLADESHKSATALSTAPKSLPPASKSPLPPSPRRKKSDPTHASLPVDSLTTVPSTAPNSLPPASMSPLPPSHRRKKSDPTHARLPVDSHRLASTPSKVKTQINAQPLTSPKSPTLTRENRPNIKPQATSPSNTFRPSTSPPYVNIESTEIEASSSDALLCKPPVLPPRRAQANGLAVKQKLSTRHSSPPAFTVNSTNSLNTTSDPHLRPTSPTSIPFKPALQLPTPLRETKTGITLAWKRGKNAPVVMSRDTDAVVNGSVLYLRPHRTRKIYSYHSTAGLWSRQSDCLTDNSTLANVDGFLTTIGGSNSNKLLTLSQTEKGKTWTEKYPNMNTDRSRCTAITTDSTLLVAGGFMITPSGPQALKSIEVLNTDLKQWATAADMPQPLYACSGELIDGYIYLLGGLDKSFYETRVVYRCSLVDIVTACRFSSALLANLKLSRRHSSVWTTVAEIPVTGATSVNIQNKLVAIGGRDEDSVPTNAVHMFDTVTNTWTKISELSNARAMSFAIVLHNDVILTVGGVAPPTEFGNVSIDSVEFARVV